MYLSIIKNQPPTHTCTCILPIIFAWTKWTTPFFITYQMKHLKVLKFYLKIIQMLISVGKSYKKVSSFFPFFTVIWNLQYVCFHDVVIKTWLSLVSVDQLPVGQRKKSYFPLKIMCSAKLDFAYFAFIDWPRPNHHIFHTIL